MQYNRRQALKGLTTVAASVAALPLVGCGSVDEFAGEEGLDQASQALAPAQ